MEKTAVDDVLIHRNGDAEVRLRVDFIHPVEGEAHAATLVVETYCSWTHDIRTLLSVLLGKRRAASLTGMSVGHANVYL